MQGTSLLLPLLCMPQELKSEEDQGSEERLLLGQRDSEARSRLGHSEIVGHSQRIPCDEAGAV